jgi:putative transposase
MLLHKAFRYRVYPTREQEARLVRWESALRFLWNLALEQRLMGLARTDKKYPSFFDQNRELTDLRRELPWLADVPRAVCAQLLSDVDRSFQRCFQRLARMPRWKRKGRDCLGVCEPHPKAWRIDGSGIRFPKLGTIRSVLHRDLSGTPKRCTLKREGDQWFASILCEIEIADPTARTTTVLALDRGINSLLADSDGNLTPNPKHYDKALKRLAHAQRAVSRKQKGSKNREKSKLRVMRIHRKVRRQREHFLHCLSSTIAKSNGVVVIEKLNVASMIRNRSLSRSIAGAGWSQFANMLRYKLTWSGGSLVEVPAQYSSQTCSVCGVVDAASRRGERFDCIACGHTDHADLNAAKVLKTRANRSGKPGDGSLPEGSGRTRKERVKLRVTRRKPLKVSAP